MRGRKRGAREGRPAVSHPQAGMPWSTLQRTDGSEEASRSRAMGSGRALCGASRPGVHQCRMVTHGSIAPFGPADGDPSERYGGLPLVLITSKTAIGRSSTTRPCRRRPAIGVHHYDTVARRLECLVTSPPYARSPCSMESWRSGLYYWYIVAGGVALALPSLSDQPAIGPS